MRTAATHGISVSTSSLSLEAAGGVTILSRTSNNGSLAAEARSTEVYKQAHVHTLNTSYVLH